MLSRETWFDEVDKQLWNFFIQPVQPIQQLLIFHFTEQIVIFMFVRYSFVFLEIILYFLSHCWYKGFR